MSNSPLVEYTQYSPYCNRMTDKKVTVITPHHAAAVVSVEALGGIAQSRGGAANYGIGNDGRIGLYVDESNSAHTSSNQANDRKAVTIEVSNSVASGDYPVSDAAMESLIKLCVDVCQRNGIPHLHYTGDLDGNMTMHAWFDSTGCPGQYLAERFPYIANEVNRRLGSDFHSPDKPNRYDRGDAVQLKPGALYYNNYLVPDWLHGKLLYIRNVFGKYYDVSISSEGGITGRVHEKYLLSLEREEVPEEVKPDVLEIGSIIQLTEDAVYTTGKAVPDWVRKNTLYLRDWITDDVAAFSIYQTGGITGHVNRKYIIQEKPVDPAPEPPATDEPTPEEVTPEPEQPGAEAPIVPYTVTVAIVEERNGFGRMESGGWIPLNNI